MKKNIIFIIIGVFIFVILCLVFCCISFFFLLPKYIKSYEKNYFKKYQDEFIEAQKSFENDKCKDTLNNKIKIGSKEFNVYSFCSSSYIVFETGSPFDPFSRVDYVYITNESEVKEVDECSERNGEYVEKLDTNWHLCYGDWN